MDNNGQFRYSVVISVNSVETTGFSLYSIPGSGLITLHIPASVTGIADVYKRQRMCLSSVIAGRLHHVSKLSTFTYPKKLKCLILLKHPALRLYLVVLILS